AFFIALGKLSRYFFLVSLSS
ncbi:DedA family protein, partial [Campylobacter upsaliensis]|nr:DedA family protein [Campylobacter upsaliensis]EAI5602787.1 DedA family protein [Campylobacter upsaliensis]EAJ8780422.1 DedA family protein [Campylobacter upsaliensis]EAK3283122.1 DedA family protein [Campylobacter upsaliensis]ECH3660175.1 DedA family protein [Campylobacter upsaliensis]